MKRWLGILLSALVILSMMTSTVFASAPASPSPSPSTSGGVGAGAPPSVTVGYEAPTSGIETGVTTILGAARWIGFVVAIGMVIWIGIKYLTAGAGQKAEVKSTMIPLLIGAALVALAPQVATWIFGMFK